MIELKKPYLLYLGDANSRLSAKTSVGIADFAPQNCLGYFKKENCEVVLENLPEISIEEAAKNGAKTFVLGLANSGGFIAENWLGDILKAIELKMDIASGLHQKLEEVEEIRSAAQKHGVNLINARHFDGKLKTGKALQRLGKRILTVGTDCSVGKMYTALNIHKRLNEIGQKAHFVATGQTGILVFGKGISIDAVASDFISGAVEEMTPSIPENEFYVIEGQASLFHPSFSGVTLGLLHGSAPDYIVMCHEPNRKSMRGIDHFPSIDLKTCIERNILMGKTANKNIKCVGISCNTSQMSEAEAKEYLLNLEKEFNLPATDPHRFGVEKIVEKILEN